MRTLLDAPAKSRRRQPKGKGGRLNFSTYDPARLTRVNRRNPCPICEHRDWCGIAADGSIAICMRVSEGSDRQTRNGGFIHVLKVLKDSPAVFSSPRTCKPEIHKPMIASIKRRHEVYTALLDALTLDDHHSSHLSGVRRLSDATIVRQLYASVPDADGLLSLSAQLSERFDLRGVPGFYRDGQWRINLWSSGILIPVRDREECIQAISIRRDEGEPRYLWFSSADRCDGASSGAPAYYARPWRIDSTNEVMITEGALKAEIIAEHLDLPVIGLAGVSTFTSDFGDELRQHHPTLQSVRVAFDSDWHDKPEVGRALLRLLDVMELAGFDVTVLDWTYRSNYRKGFDDEILQQIAD